MRRVVTRANVGRSTFYEHFESKADIFHHSLEPLLSVLAAAVEPDGDPATLVLVLEHFSDRRFAARKLLTGAAGEIAATLLAALLADRLTRTSAHTRESILVNRCASYVAGGQLAVIRGWLDDVAGPPASTVAAILRNHSVANARTVLATS